MWPAVQALVEETRAVPTSDSFRGLGRGGKFQNRKIIAIAFPGVDDLQERDDILTLVWKMIKRCSRHGIWPIVGNESLSSRTLRTGM